MRLAMAAAEVPFHLEFCYQVDIFVSHYIIDNQTSADMKKIITGMNPYESPEIVLETIENEGLLCASGKHQGFTESDDWMDLLEED